MAKQQHPTYKEVVDAFGACGVAMMALSVAQVKNLTPGEAFVARGTAEWVVAQDAGEHLRSVLERMDKELVMQWHDGIYPVGSTRIFGLTYALKWPKKHGVWHNVGIEVAREAAIILSLGEIGEPSNAFRCLAAMWGDDR